MSPATTRKAPTTPASSSFCSHVLSQDLSSVCCSRFCSFDSISFMYACDISVLVQSTAIAMSCSCPCTATKSSFSTRVTCSCVCATAALNPSSSSKDGVSCSVLHCSAKCSTRATTSRCRLRSQLLMVSTLRRLHCKYVSTDSSQLSTSSAEITSFTSVAPIRECGASSSHDCSLMVAMPDSTSYFSWIFSSSWRREEGIGVGVEEPPLDVFLPGTVVSRRC
mmetsp:Transcript_1169/g.2561  ORF Transcript_1169/g.2561 Transcript_1169/m.2561 type:complete len:222 (-) Transcript_1169:781-1446(-)